MAAEATKKPGLELVWSIWDRRKWLAVLAFLASLAGIWSALIFLPDLYKSTATVLVEGERIAVDFIKPAVTGEVDTRLQSINQQILSRSRLKQMIEQLDLYRDLRSRVSMEDLVGHMRRNIGLELKNVEKSTGQRETIAFAISFQGRDPQTVSMVTNTLASFFVEENVKARGRQANETAEFMRVQLQDMRKRLDAEEARVAGVRRRGGGEARMQTSMLTLEHVSSQMRLNAERLDRALDRRENLARQLNEVKLIDPVLGPASKDERLIKLRQDLAELRTRYTENYPDVVRLRAEIAAVERAREAKPKETEQAKSDPTVERLKQAMSEADAEIRSLKSEEKRLQQAVAAQQQKVESISIRTEEPSEVVRDYEGTKELYNSLLKRYVDARQAEELEQRQQSEKFRILDAAIPPQYPVAPNRFLLSLLGLIFSLCLAAGAVVVAEQIDTSFHSVDDVRAFTKVPVLVSIPSIVTEQDLKRRSRRFRLGLAGAVAGLMLIVGSSYYVAHDNEGLVRLLTRQRSSQSAS